MRILFDRLLEKELTALTKENNVRLTELTEQIEFLREERNQLQEILSQGLDEAKVVDMETQSRYLKHELEKAVSVYLDLQVSV